jgi:hypothetical protein
MYSAIRLQGALFRYIRNVAVAVVVVLMVTLIVMVVR